MRTYRSSFRETINIIRFNYTIFTVVGYNILQLLQGEVIQRVLLGSLRLLVTT